MKILHLIPGSHAGLTAPVIAFYDAFFDRSVHSFCLHTPSESDSVLYAGDCKIRQFNFCGDTTKWRHAYRLLRLLEAHDLVVLHNLNAAFSWKTMLLASTVFRRIFSRLVWIEWGGDLYHWCKPATSHSLMHNALTNWIYKSIYSSFGARIQNFVAIFPPDIEFFQRVFRGNAALYTAPYACGARAEIFHEFSNYTPMSRKKANHEPLRILVGHRCVQEVGPLEALRLLAKFREENIEILLPSSGWDPEYIKCVKAFAETAFADKAIWIDHYMTPVELADLVKTVDIAIFNTDRNQIALGTIMLLFSEGKKVVVSERSAMFRHFVSHGIPVCPFEEIERADFERFTADVDMENGLKYAMRVRDLPAMAREWQSIYDDIVSRRQRGASRLSRLIHPCSIAAPRERPPAGCSNQR